MGFLRDSRPARACLAALAGALICASAALLGAGAGEASQPQRCGAAETRAAVAAFARAFNRGDYETLDSLFAMPPTFRWFSSNPPGERIGPAAKRRPTLIRYFRGRRSVGDRLGLISFRFNGNWGGHGNFETTMRRSVPTFRGGDWFTLGAKGAIFCEGDANRFAVLTLGMPE